MISTYLSYRLYSADMAKSLTREASLTNVAREAAYYKANIGNIKSVDDLLDNSRVYTYAMKAYGLDDMIYAKAFMRKVLESDLTDGNSFVRRLSDPRFLKFAEAFNFATDGSIAASTVVAQGTAHEEETIGLYSDRRIKQGATAATEVDYFRARIANVRSVDELISNSRLFDFALKSVGLDPSIASTTTIRGVLTSDLSDPNSPANQLTNDAYRKLAAAFSFETDGSVANGALAQTAAQTDRTVYNYYDELGVGASPAASSFKLQYYKDHAAGVATVSDLLNDPIMFDFVATAFGLDPVSESVARLTGVLTSDLSDPNSPANTLGAAGYRAMAAAFNFNADGSLDAGVAAQTTDQLNDTLDGFAVNYGKKAAKFDNFDNDYYRITIVNIKSVDQILSTPKLYNYILNAFGLDPEVESKSTIRALLQSDPTDPTSLANLTRNQSYKKLAAAFNFDSTGMAQTERLAQTLPAMRSTMLRYIDQVGDPDVEKDETKAENNYYRDTIPTIQSLDEFLADDRLLSYVRTAYGLSGSEGTADVLRQILTSDLSDATSFANRSGNTVYREIAAAFSFDGNGEIMRESPNMAQDRQDLLTTAEFYLRQSIEERAGSENEAVRLALYFQRKAPTINTAYEILADKAVFEVVRTALGLPATMSLAQLDTQANMITKRLDLADLKDPAKVDKFLAQFSALYDITNSTNSTSSMIATLFGN